jgi:hypothetical protein
MARVLIPFLFCAFLLAGGREPPWGDAHVTYATSKRLWEDKKLDIKLDAPPYFFTVRAGKKYGIAPLGNVVAMVPSYLVQKRLMKIQKLDEPAVTALATHFMPALLMACAMALFYRVARRRGAGPPLALWLTAGLSFGTICFVYARVAYAEALQTFALMLLLERTLAQGERLTLPGMAVVGLAAGVLFNSKIVFALLLPLFAAYLLWAHLRDPARRNLKRLALGCAVALAAFAPFFIAAVWHNYVKTGTIFRSGHEGQADFFGGDLGAALYGFLLSPGKSLFLFSPPLVLGLMGLRTAWRRGRGEMLLLVGVCLVTLLVHAKFRIWHGGFCWGPRYMVPLTPVLLLLALPWLAEALGRGRVWLRRTALGALLGAGVAVQLLGGAFYWDHYMRILVAIKNQTGMYRWSEDHVVHGYFVPEFSPIRGHWWLFKHWWRKDPDLNRDVPWKGLVKGKLHLKDDWKELRIDWWGVDWLKGKPKNVVRLGWWTFGILAGGLLASGWGIRRRLRRESTSPGPAAAPPAPPSEPPAPESAAPAGPPAPDSAAPAEPPAPE